MSRHTTRRAGVAALALLTTLGLGVAAVPAQGAGSSSQRTSGTLADLDWLEVGGLPGVEGNIHLGYLSVQAASDGTVQVFGWVDDLECEPGFVPEGPGGGHGGEEEFPCEGVGSRVIDGGDVRLTVGKKFATSRLTGTLQVSDHDGTGLGNPAVDITLTGVGSTYSGSDRGRYSEASGPAYSYRFSSVRRTATVQGRIGPMVFDDEAGEFSSASVGTFKDSYRQRIR